MLAPLPKINNSQKRSVLGLGKHSSRFNLLYLSAMFVLLISLALMYFHVILNYHNVG